MRDGMDRREFLAAGIAATGMVGVGSPAPASPTPRLQPIGAKIRYSVFHPYADLETYRAGVAKMKQWSRDNIDDPRGWTFQAAIHDSVTPGPYFGKCKHESHWFLPWHRAYLYFFERIIRQATGNLAFTLPYWDWSTPRRDYLPPLFREVGNDLYDPKRTVAANRGDFLSSDRNRGRDIDVTAILNAPTFYGNRIRAGFGASRQDGTAGAMERPPHNAVHNLVGGPGGNMADAATAALDPIFWVHHANVDRLWDVWLSGGKSNPTDPAWMNNTTDGRQERWAFFDGDGSKVEVTTAEFVQGGERLDYEYDNINGNSRSLLVDVDTRRRLQEGRRVFAMAGPPGVRNGANGMQNRFFGDQDRVVITSNDNRIVLGAAPVTIQAAIDPKKAEGFMMAAPAGAEPADEAPATMLNIEGVKATAPPGVVFQVFLNPSDKLAGAEPADENYVGSIALFKSSARGHSHAPGTDRNNQNGDDFSFNVTDLVNSLKDRGKWDDSKVNVTIVGRGMGGENQPAGEVSVSKVSVSIDRP